MCPGSNRQFRPPTPEVEAKASKSHDLRPLCARLRPSNKPGDHPYLPKHGAVQAPVLTTDHQPEGN